MEQQKKNDDLCSKLENDMPEGIGELNELEEFNGGKNMLKNINGDEIEPQTFNNKFDEEEPQNRKNSLLMMEADGFHQ